MNYKPFAGYYFYGATNYLERASYASSYGLLGLIPTSEISVGFVNTIFSPFIFLMADRRYFK